VAASRVDDTETVTQTFSRFPSAGSNHSSSLSRLAVRNSYVNLRKSSQIVAVYLAAKEEISFATVCTFSSRTLSFLTTPSNGGQNAAWMNQYLYFYYVPAPSDKLIYKKGSKSNSSAEQGKSSS
jgi:hypothetical protein